MKFVSALLIAMIAMILVLPALGCEQYGGDCHSSQDCCGIGSCMFREKYGKQNGINKAKCEDLLAKPNMSQVRRSLLSALSMLEDH